MRGKPYRPWRPRRRAGNIPAYAGKTLRLSSTAPSTQEHPRVCGENKHQDSSPSPILGTSPRMRGKRSPMKPTPPLGRNIPAYAGKTLFWPGRRGGSAEHPRVCGENGNHWPPPFRKLGTSPRMRGKQYRSRFPTRLGRNIPAYAGKTNPYRWR